MHIYNAGVDQLIKREVLNFFYRGAIESILTGNITQWQGSCFTQDNKNALQ